jgi:anti-sigma B factor antagonist
MSLTVTRDPIGPYLVARLSGELDREAEGDLGELGDSLDGFEGLIVDFSGTGFISSSGLALLVRLVRSAGEADIGVAAVGLDEHYKHVFEITRLDQFLLTAEDHDAAIAALTGGGQ